MAADSSSPVGYKLLVSPNKASGNTVDIYYIQPTFDSTGSTIIDL